MIKNFLLHRRQTRTIGAFLLFNLLFACDGKETPPPNNAKANEATGDDDYDVVAAVPINLLNAADWKQLKEQLQQSLAKSTKPKTCLEEKAVWNASASDVWSDSHLRAVADQVLAAPCYASENLTEIVSQIERLHQNLFSSSSLFGRNPIKMGLLPGQTSHTVLYRFASPQERYYYAAVTYSKLERQPFKVALYGAAVGDKIPLLTQISFAANSENTKLLTASLLYLSSGPEPLWLEANFDGSTKGLIANYGPMKISEQYPARNWLQLDVLNSDEIQIAGGYIWDLDLGKIPENALAPPRFEWLEKGDIELYRARARLADQREMVQQQAFVAVSDRIQLGESAFEQGQNFFNDRTYQNYLESHVEEVIRRPDLSASCSTFGASIRNLFVPGPLPASLSAIPDDFCQSNSSLSSREAIEALADTCSAGKAIAVAITSMKGPVNYQVCAKLGIGKQLSELVYSSLPDLNSVRILVPADQIHSNHSHLAESLKNSVFPSFKELLGPTPAFTGRAANELEKAIELK